MPKNIRVLINKINKILIKRFVSIYEFCTGDINKLILLLRKEVYPCEYMDSWKRFDEISLPGRKNFLQQPKYGRFTNVDYRHIRVFKNL